VLPIESPVLAHWSKNNKIADVYVEKLQMYGYVCLERKFVRSVIIWEWGSVFSSYFWMMLSDVIHFMISIYS